MSSIYDKHRACTTRCRIRLPAPRPSVIIINRRIARRIITLAASCVARWRQVQAAAERRNGAGPAQGGQETGSCPPPPSRAVTCALVVGQHKDPRNNFVRLTHVYFGKELYTFAKSCTAAVTPAVFTRTSSAGQALTTAPKEATQWPTEPTTWVRPARTTRLLQPMI